MTKAGADYRQLELRLLAQRLGTPGCDETELLLAMDKLWWDTNDSEIEAANKRAANTTEHMLLLRAAELTNNTKQAKLDRSK